MLGRSGERRTTRRTEKGKPSDTAATSHFIVELRHPDPSRTLRLQERIVGLSDVIGDIRARFQDQKEPFRKELEACARLLHVPLLYVDGGKLVKRDVGDLDKSVRELVQAGKVEAQFNPVAPPPAGIQTAPWDGGQVLTIAGALPIPIRGRIIGLAAGVGFTGGGLVLLYFCSKLPVLLIPGVLATLLGPIMILGARSKPKDWKVYVSPETIRYVMVTKQGERECWTVAAARVEHVMISPNRSDVIVVTDAGSRVIGGDFSQEAREWLRNLILHVITQ